MMALRLKCAFFFWTTLKRACVPVSTEQPGRFCWDLVMDTAYLRYISGFLQQDMHGNLGQPKVLGTYGLCCRDGWTIVWSISNVYTRCITKYKCGIFNCGPFKRKVKACIFQLDAQRWEGCTRMHMWEYFYIVYSWCKVVLRKITIWKIKHD